jgi:hypothetical protein
MLPDEILPGLYLGSWIGAVNKHLLKHLGVTHILTVASQLTPAFVEVPSSHTSLCSQLTRSVLC